MRKRKEIQKLRKEQIMEAPEIAKEIYLDLIFELLLDIRDLMEKVIKNIVVK